MQWVLLTFLRPYRLLYLPLFRFLMCGAIFSLPFLHASVLCLFAKTTLNGGLLCCVCVCYGWFQVFLLEGWNAADGAPKGDGEDGKTKRKSKRGGVVRVRKTSSAELGGIRLHSNMMDDHSMTAYEPAVVAAAQRYRKRRDDPAREKS